MQVLLFPKGRGTWRKVHSPSPTEKKRYLRLLPMLAQAERAAALAAGTSDVAHGFVEGRNPVTCALPHMGFPVTVCCDMAGWFDSVTTDQVRAGLYVAGADLALADQTCYKGAPRQGLPSSPAACNLAAVEMDRRLLRALARLPGPWAYTRYADDLSVSCQARPDLEEMVLAAITGAVESMGWALAPHKTKIQRATAGRRVLVGISVGENNVRAPRWMRRRLRAARYQSEEYARSGANGPNFAEPVAQGLAEWCAMKLPRGARPTRQIRGCVGGATPAVETPAPAPVVMVNGVAGGTLRRIKMS